MKSFALIVAFILTASITLIAVPTVHGQATLTNIQTGYSEALPSGVTPGATYSTIPYLNFAPTTIGLGQSILINMWIEPPIYVEREFYNAYTITLTNPSGSTITLGPFSSFQGDTTAYTTYTPDAAGNWTIQSNFLGGYFPPGNYTGIGGVFLESSILNCPLGVYYSPSSSAVYKLTVQPSLIASWPPSSLPTSYWSVPVYATNREWDTILGGYPGTGVVGGSSNLGQPTNWPADTDDYMCQTYGFVPFVTGPTSAHIAWRTMGAIAGLIGGSLGTISLYPTPPLPSIIYDGMAYMTYNEPGAGLALTPYWVCYNVQTGQIIWQRPLQPGETAPNNLLYIRNTIQVVPGNTVEARNTAVLLQYCGGGRLIEYDPWTGAVDWNISIAPLSSGTYYETGYYNPCFYSVQTIGTHNFLINWTVEGTPSYPTIVNIQMVVMSNISWPFSSLGLLDIPAGVSVVSSGITPSSTGVVYAEQQYGISLSSGAILWNITDPGLTTGLGGYYCAEISDQGFYAARLNDGHWDAWNIQTGVLAWVSPLSSFPWGIFGEYGVQSWGGLLIQAQYDGIVAYNWTTGAVVWHYDDISPYATETDFATAGGTSGLVPYDNSVLIADGMVYAGNSEHPPPTQPLDRAFQLTVMNATTGKGIWSVSGMYGLGGIEDGYLVAGSQWDGYIYGFGPGQSATTVSAPQTAVTLGDKVLIQGTVFDMSPATKTSSVYAGGQGVPCVSDASMATMMEYVYMQQPINGVNGSVTITGVPVILSYVDPNGNTGTITTVTTDGASGTYGYTWTPPIAGQYKITATFAGDDSYGYSWATTYVTVAAAAPTPTPVPTAPPVTGLATASDLTYGIIAAVIAIIIAIAIVGILLLRKRQ